MTGIGVRSGPHSKWISALTSNKQALTLASDYGTKQEVARRSHSVTIDDQQKLMELTAGRVEWPCDMDA